MKVLIIKPGKAPEERDIKNELKSLQEIVGGYIEAVYHFADSVVIICNEEGKLLGLPLNRTLFYEDGGTRDIIAGTFIVCGVNGEEFDSLSDELLDKYKSVFADSEKFV